ncbi:MAG: hypothetical protein JWN70_510 [Planctomycetaceae bacterium]|nr:hypothetical protein [Planctomycetaceae bacterium]
MSTVTKPAEQLLEAWGDVVATTDSGWLQDYDSGYGTTLAHYQRPATTLFDRTDGRFLPIYQTEFDLAVIRAMGRTLAQVSPALVGAVRSMCNYTIGEGFTFTANRDDTADLSPADSQPLVDAVQREINTLLDDTDFVGSFDREIHNSSIEDGEVFLHLKPSCCGGVKISRCEPDQVRQPALSRELEDWVSDAFGIACDEFVSSWSFGVHTRADEPDVALGYHVVADESGVNWEYIPASRMVHIKRNVPRNAKRGFSDFYPVEADATRGEKLRRNMAEGAAVQSAIAYVRQHVQGATRVGVEQMLGENKVGTSQQQLPMGGSRSRNVVQYRPGTVVDLSAGLEYKPGPMGSDRANDFMVVAQYVQRMQAIRWSMPEYMFTGDASNANYSSTLVAESPFVKSCEAEQRFYSRHFVSVLWKALQIRWELGAFEQFGVTWEELEQTIEIKAECPDVATRDELANVQRQEILIRLGVMSRKTAATQNGLDYEAEVALGAAPEGQEGCSSNQGGEAAATALGLSEQALFECHEKGGKPGPCPKNLPKQLKKGRRKRADSEEPNEQGPIQGAGSSKAKRPIGTAEREKPTFANAIDSKSSESEPLRARDDTDPTQTVPSEAELPASQVSASSKARLKKHKSNTKARQVLAQQTVDHLAKRLGAKPVGDNAPSDLTKSYGAGTTVQFEVKVLLDREGDDLRMKSAAQDRKSREFVDSGQRIYTLILDGRESYAKDKNAPIKDYTIWFANGAASGNIKSRHRIESISDIHRFVQMKPEDLPDKAKPTAEWLKRVAAAKANSELGKLKGPRAIAAQADARKGYLQSKRKRKSK